MRVTASQLYDNLLNGVKQQLEVQDRGNAQVASGTRFQTPSEAGLDYKQSLDIRHAQTSIQGGLDAIAIADSRLSISQTLLNDMNNVLTRAQSLAIQQSNAALSAAERQASANEVSHLLERFLADANQTWKGQSVFGGTAVDQPAFVQDSLGNITYNGSDQDRTVSVDANQQGTARLLPALPGELLCQRVEPVLRGFQVSVRQPVPCQHFLQRLLPALYIHWINLVNLTRTILSGKRRFPAAAQGNFPVSGLDLTPGAGFRLQLLANNDNRSEALVPAPGVIRQKESIASSITPLTADRT